MKILRLSPKFSVNYVPRASLAIRRKAAGDMAETHQRKEAKNAARTHIFEARKFG